MYLINHYFVIAIIGSFIYLYPSKRTLHATTTTDNSPNSKLYTLRIFLMLIRQKLIRIHA